jgi:trigger factor
VPVSIEPLSGLERRMNFAIPAERIYDAVQRRLGEIARQVKLDGFRQGRAPLAVVERQFGQEVRQEVIGGLLLGAFHEAAQDAGLKLAGSPAIEWRSAPEAPEASPEGPEFVATFEVYPEFELAPVEALRIERPVVDIGEEDVDRMLEALRRLRLEWEPVERPAQEGDRVMVDLKGYFDDEPLREIRRIPFVLGVPVKGGAFGAGVQNEFARQLAGLRAGECVDLEIGFPDDYEKGHLAGQNVRFTIHACSVEAPRLPELDDALADKLSVEGGLAALRAQTRASMEDEAQTASRALVKQRVLAALLAANPILLPKVRVESESRRLAEQVRERMLADGFKEADIEIAALLAEDRAKQHVALGLILAKIVAEQNLPVDQAALARAVSDIAAQTGDGVSAEEWLQRNPGILAELESVLMEDQVVDWVLARAQVVDLPHSFAAFMRDWKPED